MSIDYKILATLLLLFEDFHNKMFGGKIKNDGKPHAYLWLKNRFISMFQIREHLSLFHAQSFIRDYVGDKDFQTKPQSVI